MSGTPYFIRQIGGEILHIVSVSGDFRLAREMRPKENTGKNCEFLMWGGIVTLYDRKLKDHLRRRISLCCALYTYFFSIL